MEKVKISQKQADAIEKYKQEARKQHAKMTNVKPPFDTESWALPLHFLSTTDFSRALFSGYEVEDEFKDGDWVAVEWDEGKDINVIVGFESHGRMIVDNEGLNNTPPNGIVRHATDEEIATEKQRRFWNGNNRDVWELDLYDCVINKYGAPFVVMGVTDDYLKNGTSYELSNGTEYPKDDMEPFFKVLYFAEDRKDIN